MSGSMVVRFHPLAAPVGVVVQARKPESPTTTHKVVLGQDTPVNAVDVRGTAVQSAGVAPGAVDQNRYPAESTATQRVDEVPGAQEMPVSTA